MKIIVTFLVLFTITGIAFSQTTPDDVLTNVSKKLNSLKQLRYTNTRELNYSSEDYHNVTTFTEYYDLESRDTLIGCKYQIEDPLGNTFFNGTEIVDLSKQQKTIQINDRPGIKSFNASGLYNSLLTLRNILPVLIQDTAANKSIADTTIENANCHLITINIQKRRIWNSGKGFDPMKTKSDFIYKLIVNKTSLLPMIVWQVNDKNSDFIKTQFTNIDTHPAKPAEDSWNYATYLTEYTRPVKKDKPEPLAIGSPAPGFKLPVSNSDKTLSLDELKGKVVLVDFWIKACSPCIAAIPHLKELQQQFSNKPFEIVSINAYDAPDVVNSYTKFHKITYTTLFNGKDVAEQYGVKGYPKFYLLDKEGKIIFMQEGFEDATRSAVEKLLKEIL